MITQIPTHRMSSNYATADRPRCMIRDEIYLNQQQPRQFQKDNRRNFRYDDGIKHDEWNWNMSHLEYDHVVSSSSSTSNVKKSQKLSKNKNGYVPSSRSTTSSSTSSFQSFFRWFRRDHNKTARHRVNDITYPKDITYLNDDVNETDDDEYAARYSRNSRHKTQKVKETTDYPPSSSQKFSNYYSSCDSVFSTASSFAFVPPVKYLKNRNQKQPVKQQQQQQHQPQFDDRSYTESYQKRVKARDQALERDKREEITLRRKYHLYDESSDIENLNNDDSLRTKSFETRRNFDLKESNHVPVASSSSRSTNFSDTEKLQDLNSRQHRRANSDIISGSKKTSSGSYLHVKGKRKAPSPPKSRTNPRTLPKKRPAPLPPLLKLQIEEETATASSTSLLEDKDIKALIEGNFSKKDFSSTPTLTAADMERKPAYVSPYLKIRENRKLTDEQKRILIEQVSTNSKKSIEISSMSNGTALKKNDQIFTIQEGQLIYQGNESPKLPLQSEEKLVAPSSPISPRPWFKRNSVANQQQKDLNQNQSIFRTLEKKIHKSEDKEKDLPEYTYSRNSFFGSRFNIFAKLASDESNNKKKEKEQEKRRSQIGIPNISELDREAAEIIQIGQELKKDVSEVLLMRAQGNSLQREEAKVKVDMEKLKSTKELIDKFESDASKFNPRVIAVNNASTAARKEFFGETHEIPTPITVEEINKKEEKLPKKSSPPKDDVKSSPMLESRKSKLPQLVNGIRKQDDLMGLWICTYCTLQNPNWKIICEACEKVKPYEKKYNVNNGDVNLKTTLNWDKKTEMVLKYFQPPVMRSGGLSKSASETIVNKSLSVKQSKIPGSPLLNTRRSSKYSPEKRVNEIQRIIREHELKTPSIVATTTNVNDRPKSGNSHTKTPDLNALRSARLAKFNFPSHKSLDIEKVKKSSQEKFVNERINFNDPVSLEREKERLREKIRLMNTRALAEKYPVQKPTEVEIQQNKAEPSAPVLTPPTTNESSKLGAIRKVRKIEETLGTDEEKIINKNEKDEKSPEKLDSECQTTLKNSAKNKKIDDKFLEPLTSEKQQQVEINEISEQLQSKNGIENFKSSLSMNKTDTLAINKILRYLEAAISDGNHNEAAEFAMNLAKMKVSLSVTRQRDRPKSEVEPSLQNVKVNLNIRNGVRDLVKKQLSISLLMTVNELKQKIESDYSIQIANQKIFINKDLIDNSDDKFLGNYVRPDGMMDVVIYNKKPLNNTPHYNNTVDSESDDETQNEKVGAGEIGAIGGKVLEPAKVENLEKIENKGWECTLCTLINKPESQSCAACSTGRPNLNKLPATLNDIEYKLKVNEDLQKFYEFEKIELREQSNNSKNDLNRHSANRKSSDILNILKDEKAASFNELTECSPNISKTKYRGVDNFNPNIAYAFPKQQPKLEVRKPVITNVIYKSTLSDTKESIKARLNHYQELMKLDIANIAPNTELFECSICFLEIPKSAGAILRECLHTFCRPCLASHIKYSDEPEIKCPYIDHQYSCQCVLQEREIRALVSKEVYDTHLAKSIRIAEHKIENTFHCKTPNCSGWCIFEDTTNIFKCPVCTIVNCLTCGAIHDGLNCKQFQDQLANNDDSESAHETRKLLQELIEKDEAMNCPTCHIFLLKKWGCDWLKCSFCKTEICWVTRGSRWGPNGKGDTSGGCKCGVNGKKCSAKCNYCH